MRNIKPSIVMLAIGSLLVLNACKAQDDKKANDPVVATVNGSAIHQSQVDAMMRVAQQQGAGDTPEIRKLVMDELVGREVLLQEALKQGLDKTPEVQKQLDQLRQDFLVRNLVQDYVKKNPPTDDQLKAEYDKIREKIGDKQYSARHILVKTEKEAKDLIAQLNKGAKFEKLAKEKSTDKGSAERGGDLGPSPANRFVPQFAKALESLKPGETTKTPVQTQYGWHVIHLDSIQPAPTFEQVKGNLTPQVQQEQLRKYIEGLREKAKVEVKTVAAPAPAHPAEHKPEDKPAAAAPATEPAKQK